MAIVSVKLKAIMDKELKSKVEEAHFIFNEYVKRFEDFLILAYGNDYYYTDKNNIEQYREKEDVKSELYAYLKAIPEIKDVDAAMKAVSMLPGIIREKASNAAGMLTKLYNKESSAGTNNIAKIISPEPEWLQYYDKKHKIFISDEGKGMADLWIASEKGQKAIEPIMTASGRPSKFKEKYLSNKEWYAAYVDDQEKYKKDCEDGLARMLQILEVNNALPLVNIPEQLIQGHPVWVRLFLKIALENFASYLECDDATREEYNQQLQKYKNDEAKVTSQFLSQEKKLRKFLDENYLQDGNIVFLTKRMCRGIEKVLREWNKKSSYQERLEVLKDYQANDTKKREIGDINFLNWLALDENQDMLQSECLSTILEYHTSLKVKEEKRKCASFTTADPLLSKRYIFYENETGTNYKKYKIFMQGNHYVVKLPLLLKTNNIYCEEEIEFKLAASTQFKINALSKGKVVFANSKRMLNEYNEEVEETFSGKMGGMDIRVDTNGVGKLKNIYLSITITVDEQCTEQFIQDSKNTYFCFASAYNGKESKYSEKLQSKTLKALSIDLGLKQFAACSVAGINYEGTFDIQEPQYERMFMLRLPGEDCTKEIEHYRKEAMREIRSIHTDIKYASVLKQLYHLESVEKRNRLIKNNVNYISDHDKLIFYQQLLQEENIEKTNQALSKEYDRVICYLNKRMMQFRSGDMTKKQARLYRPGKSLWSINYLEELRKLIMSWNSLGYHINDQNRKMSIQYGVSATKLLNHINSLKDDRIKTGADMIVQAARGYAYIDGVWQKKYDTCHVIIFEDLSRYSFSLDRPKQENSKLMQWAHRSIVKEVKRQAALYGITVYDSTDSAYSSKFHYKTDAPGIRCDRLSKLDFDELGNLRTHVLEKLPDCLKEVSDKLKVGSLIPSKIGSIFLTMDKAGRLIQLNADMNAAANLQKRFWMQHTYLFRLSTVNVDGELKLKGDEDVTSEKEKGFQLGKREKGKYLYHYGTTKLMLTNASTPGHFKLVKRSKHIQNPQVGENKTYNLFNDPTGVFFKSDEWIGYQEYWQTIQERLNQELVKMN